MSQNKGVSYINLVSGLAVTINLDNNNNNIYLMAAKRIVTWPQSSKQDCPAISTTVKHVRNSSTLHEVIKRHESSFESENWSRLY